MKTFLIFTLAMAAFTGLLISPAEAKRIHGYWRSPKHIHYVSTYSRSNRRPSRHFKPGRRY
jgi:hypothetical protein